MKKPLLSLLLLFSFVALLHADLVIVQHVEGAGQNGETTMKVKGDKVRVDVQDQMSVIMDLTSGDAVTLMHAQKSYMEMKGEMMKQMMGAAADQMKLEETAKAEPLGKTEELDGHKTELYTMSFKMGGESVETTYWVAKDYPNADKFKAAMKAMESSPIGTMMKKAPQTSDLPGIPLKSVAKIPSMGEITTRLISLKEEKLDDDTFKAPTDYTALALPNMPQVPAAPAANP